MRTSSHLYYHCGHYGLMPKPGTHQVDFRPVGSCRAVHECPCPSQRSVRHSLTQLVPIGTILANWACWIDIEANWWNGALIGPYDCRHLQHWLALIFPLLAWRINSFMSPRTVTAPFGFPHASPRLTSLCQSAVKNAALILSGGVRLGQTHLLARLSLSGTK